MFQCFLDIFVDEFIPCFSDRSHQFSFFVAFSIVQIGFPGIVIGFLEAAVPQSPSNLRCPRLRDRGRYICCFRHGKLAVTGLSQRAVGQRYQQGKQGCGEARMLDFKRNIHFFLQMICSKNASCSTKKGGGSSLNFARIACVQKISATLRSAGCKIPHFVR